MARTSYRTPLSRARGLGSAHQGVNRFILERATSVALIPLSLWAVYAGFRIGPGGYDGAVAFLQSPLNLVLAVLFVAISALHMEAGLRVVIEDYVHTPLNRIAALLANAGVCWLAAALAIFSVLKVALTAAGAR